MKAMFFLSAIFLLFLSSQTEAGFVTRLYPHPLTQTADYNPYESTVERLMQFQRRYEDTKIYQTPQVPLYMIRVNLPKGKNKTVTVQVGLDTGSSLFWVRCFVLSATYNPLSSPTFRFVSSCAQIRDTDPINCTPYPTGCFFSLDYSDKKVSGRYAYETVGFGDSGVGFENMLMGCSQSSQGFESSELKAIDGIMGVGLHATSILSQLQVYEFSYCFGELAQGGTGDVFMVGSNEMVETFLGTLPDPTPYTSSGYHYQINLVGISFGNTMIGIELGESKTLLDLGSSLSILMPHTYNGLYNAVSDWMMQTSHSIAPRHGNRTCYWGTLDDLEDDFPSVIYHFFSAGVLELDKYNMFKEGGNPKRICFNVIQPHCLRCYRSRRLHSMAINMPVLKTQH